MAVPFQHAQIDFSQLAGIGDSLGQGYSKRRLKSDMQGIVGPDGVIDYNKAISVLMQHDPYKGLSLATQKAEADAIGNYRAQSLIPQSAREAEYFASVPQGDPRAAYAPAAPVTKGQSAVDTAFGKDYAEWKAAGGYADTEKQLGQLDSVLQRLESGTENLSGPAVGLAPDRLMRFVNPAAVDTRQAVEEVVQRNLRKILGAQFTAQEGERLISRAYDPQADEKENAKRLRRLVSQIRGAAKAKEDAVNYFEQHGTLTGWRGASPSFTDINPDVPNIDEGNQTAVPMAPPQPQAMPSVPSVNAQSAPPVPGASQMNVGPGARPVPSPDKIQLLRQFANNPEAVAAFDEIYGAGAAQHFLVGGR